MTRKRYGSDVIVDVIKQYDFEYASFNPGSSFRALHDSLVHYGGNARPEMIECPHENTAVGIAHGYAKALGKPMLVILHNLVGLLHGTMAIYYAYTDRVPMVIAGATGPMDLARRRPHIDWIHTALVQGNAIRDYVKWDDQPYSLASVPESFARAYRVANTEPKGPTYVCFDVTTQEDPVEEEIALLDVQKLRPPTPIQAEGAALERAAELLVGAKSPVVLAGYLGRNREAVGRLVELSELLGLPVIDRADRFNFPNTHALDLTGSDLLKTADVVLALDVRDLAGPTTKVASVHERQKSLQSILPEPCKVIEMGLSDLGISSWSMQYEKLQETELSILCDTSVALPELVERCRRKLSGREGLREEIRGRVEALSARHAELRKQWKVEAGKDWDAVPMTAPRLVSELWEAIRNEDWVFTGTNASQKNWPRKLWDWDQPHRYVGHGLGTGTHINISLGVALAYKGTGKLVVDLQPDGDLLFDAAALWVAAHHQIPILVVMYNNRSYLNSWNHQRALARERGNPVEMANVGTELDHPAPDYARLAQSFGWYAEGPIEDPRKLQDALRRAVEVVREGRPALVDAVTGLS